MVFKLNIFAKVQKLVPGGQAGAAGVYQVSVTCHLAGYSSLL